MARQAVQPVQLEVFLKSRQAQETKLSGAPHAWKILEAQVVPHQFDDLFRLARGKPQATANLLRHLCSYFHVVIESDAFADGKRRRLANVVEEHSQSQRRGGR